MKFIFSISLLIISGIMFFAILNPLYGDISVLRTQVATYNNALSNAQQLQSTRDDLLQRYNNINPNDENRLEHFLPSTVDNIKFILEIENIANIYSMPIENIKFDPVQVQSGTTTTTSQPGSIVITPNDPANSKPYGVFPIEFTTSGDYNSFVLFLQGLEHNLRLVDIKSISFTVPDPKTVVAGTNPNTYTYSFKIDIYWLK